MTRMMARLRLEWVGEMMVSWELLLFDELSVVLPLELPPELSP